VSPHRIFDVPHCVDNEYFERSAVPYQTPHGRQAARASFGLALGEFVVLFVGKLQSKKRPIDLVRAAARLPGSNVTLLFVGDGRLKQHLLLEAARHDVRMIAPGFLQPTALGRAYAAADCLALPSDSGETWGLVVNEALASGIPCVVSEQVGCAPDLIEPGVTGEVFPAGNVDALAAALARIRRAYASGRQWKADCRERVKRYSFEVATAGLLDACLAVSHLAR
jgi:glycosyltransferase involved in cell wall biosynthesis